MYTYIYIYIYTHMHLSLSLYIYICINKYNICIMSNTTCNRQDTNTTSYNTEVDNSVLYTTKYKIYIHKQINTYK